MSDDKKSFEDLAKEGKSSGTLSDLLGYMSANKKWWLLPVMVTFLLIGALLVLSQTVAAPFIYTLF